MSADTLDLVGFDLDERITELDVHDSERENPYVRCDYCDDVAEVAEMATGNQYDGYVCHRCLIEEQREHTMSHRRYW